MIKIALVTVGRSDYGIFRSLLFALESADDFALQLIVSGSHLSARAGHTVDAIQRDGFNIEARICTENAEDEENMPRSFSKGVAGFAEVYSRLNPDFVIVLGDRFETFSAVVAASLGNFPIVHLHGGEISEGAIDDGIRHAITKLAHIHFVAAEPFARRVIQMGEDPARVYITGALGIESLKLDLPADWKLLGQLGLSPDHETLLLAYHPVTRFPDQTMSGLENVLTAIVPWEGTILVTGPNQDPQGLIIRTRLQQFCGLRPKSIYVENLGSLFPAVLASASIFVGNSSSGILEAASFAVPVINVGLRQYGRLRPPNVIDVTGDSVEEIKIAMQKARAPLFRENIRLSENPYGDGMSSRKMMDILRDQPAKSVLLRKAFNDLLCH